MGKAQISIDMGLWKRGLEKGVEKVGKVGKITEVRKFLIAGVLAAMGCGQVGAQVVYETIADNLGVTPISLEQQFQAGGAFAQAFQTGSNLSGLGDGDGNGQVLHTFQVHLAPWKVIDIIADTTEYAETNFTFQLWSDNSGQPGSLLNQNPAFSTVKTVSSPTVETFSFQSDPILQPGTQYWVRISAQPISAAFATMAGVYSTTSTSSTGTGSFGTSQYFDGSSWGGISSRYVMSIQVESVPEPGSGALLVLGMSLLVATRRRRRNAASPVWPPQTCPRPSR